jgi:hypothetical protein
MAHFVYCKSVLTAVQFTEIRLDAKSCLIAYHCLFGLVQY